MQAHTGCVNIHTEAALNKAKVWLSSELDLSIAAATSITQSEAGILQVHILALMKASLSVRSATDSVH